MQPASRTASTTVWSWLTLVAIVGTFIVNVWSNLSPLNGQSIGEISNTLFADVLIIPANYAFAIWGLIYLGLLGFGIYQLLPDQQVNPALQRIRPWLIGASIAQAVWIFLFLSRQFWFSVLAMLVILLSLIAIYLQVAVGHFTARTEKWLVRVPFGVYLGWISVATIVNVALALDSQNWNGSGIAPAVWTVLMMAIAAVIAATLTLQQREIAYPLVIIWALVAIAVRQAETAAVATAAVGLAVALAVLVLVKVGMKPKVS